MTAKGKAQRWLEWQIISRFTKAEKSKYYSGRKAGD